MTIEQSQLRRIAPGQIIGASWLNETVDVVNHLQRQIRRPRQLGGLGRNPSSTPQGTLDAQQDEEEGVITDKFQISPSSSVWLETSRLSETVRVTNPEDSEQYVDVSRALISVVKTPAGDVSILWKPDG